MDPGTLLVLVIPLAPLVGGAAAAFGGRLMPADRCALPVVIGCGLSGAAAAGMLVVPLTRGATALAGVVHEVELYRWFGSRGEPPAFRIGLWLDGLSLVLIVAVALATTLVAFHAAAGGARGRVWKIQNCVEPGGVRGTGALRRNFEFSTPDPGLFAAIALVHFALVMLLAAGDLFQAFVFWQMLSVAVWLLVRGNAPDGLATHAAGRVLLTNLAGDALLLTGILLCGSELGTLSLGRIEERVEATRTLAASGSLAAGRMATLGLVGFLIAAAAIVRSGQFPVFGWLSDAGRDRPADGGAASALVQAAILPTGVWLVMRLEPLLSVAADAGWMLLVLGSLTAVAAGVVALYERDMQQVLLFTTAGQLGLAMAGVATGEPAGVAGAVLMIVVLLTARTAFVLSAAGAPPAGRATGWLALVLLAGGLGGQHAMLASLWTHADAGQAHALVAGLAALGIPLTAAALTRLWLERGSASPPAPLLAPAILTGTAALAIALSLVFFGPFVHIAAGTATADRAATLDGPMILVTLLLAAVGFIAGWLLWLRRWPADEVEHEGRESSGAALPRLARRRFYVDEVFFLLLVFPVRAAAQVARFFEWLFVEGLASALPRRVPRWAAWWSHPLESGSGQFTAVALVLAAAVLLIVLISG